MKKGFILGAVCLFALCGCGKVPKLANGEEAVITFKKDDTEHNISANDLYEMLKDNYGLLATVDLLDKYILETEFPDYIESAKKTADNNIDSWITLYGGESNLLNALLSQTSFNSIDAYRNYMYIETLRSHAVDEFAKTKVTDKDIEDYYKNEAKGDVEVYHILITPQVTDNMTSEEEKEAKNKAEAKINEVLAKLKDADDKFATFKELVKEYSEDESTKNKDGNLGYINYYDLSSDYDELLDAAYKLKDGEYSTSMITTELGYHVIYRNASKEKDTLENLKDKIIDIIATKLKEQDSKISIHALKYYRDLYNMNIVDSNLNSEYGVYLNSQLNAQENSEE